LIDELGEVYLEPAPAQTPGLWRHRPPICRVGEAAGLDNFVRARLRLCARFTQPFLVIAVARAGSTFKNRNNRSALGTQMQVHDYLLNRQCLFKTYCRAVI
jgi:hypothetical protein